MTALLHKTIELTSTHAANPAALKILYDSLMLISKIFYSLNAQDLPEFFEEHMKDWFGAFHTLLSAPEVPSLASDDDEHPGVIEQLKQQLFENITLYTTKYCTTCFIVFGRIPSISRDGIRILSALFYFVLRTFDCPPPFRYDDEFRDAYLQTFIQVTWQTLMATGKQVKYDQLVSVAMKVGDFHAFLDADSWFYPPPISQHCFRVDHRMLIIFGRLFTGSR